MVKKLFFVFWMLVLTYTITVSAEDNISRTFNEKYNAWKNYILKPEISMLSIAGPRFECSQFKEIVNMGMPALPYIIRAIEQDKSVGDLLWRAVKEIAKVDVRGQYDEKKKVVVFSDFPDLKPSENVYVHWYRYGRFQTPQRFEKLYTEWKELKKQNKQKESGKTYQKIKDLGLDVLPLIVEKMDQGEDGLDEVFAYLTDEPLNKEQLEIYSKTGKRKAQAYKEWWEKNKEKWIIPGSEQLKP
jgi:hypothetical protein